MVTKGHGPFMGRKKKYRKEGSHRTHLHNLKSSPRIIF